MTSHGRKTNPSWRYAWILPAISLVCVLAGFLIARLREEPPPNCDFSCAMAEIGWQDYTTLLLLGGGAVAFCVFVLVCLFVWTSMAVSALLDLWR